MSVNLAIIIGKLGRDPELRFTPNGKPVASFSVATEENWKGNDGQKQSKTEWHNIVAWGKLGELANQYLKKGSSAYIEGRITTSSWDDKDGNKRYKTEVVANKIKFLGGTRQDHGESNGAPENTQPDDDLPF
jgi:single-strand DNA-binding protein